MQKSLEDCVPRWAIGRIIKKVCNCGRKYERDDIVQIGIRKVKTDKDKHLEALAIEVFCPNCNKGSITTFSQNKQNFRQLLCSLLEEMQKLDRLEMAVKNEQVGSDVLTKISDKEVQDFKKELNTIEVYNDFLKKLGIDSDEIK